MGKQPHRNLLNGKQAKAASHADDLDDEESAVEIDEEFDDAGEQE